LGEFEELLLITLLPPNAHIDVSSFYTSLNEDEPPPELLELVWPEFDCCIKIGDAE
jgi:hypothetical protein